MNHLERLTQQYQETVGKCNECHPIRKSNQFYGVGPITNLSLDEMDGRMKKLEFEKWVEESYLKYDDKGNFIGNFTVSELNRSMHRGYPADKILLDMVRGIHSYFEFPKKNKIAIGLGGGHSGFTVAAMHLMNANDEKQIVFVDTPKPESKLASAGGFFRQSWGTQLMEMQKYAKKGNIERILFANSEGTIPPAWELKNKGVKLFFGVGHETTGATTYTEKEIENLLEWIEDNLAEHHAVIDATSLLGSMVWSNKIIKRLLDRCNMFMPFQKAIGGVSGYFSLVLTPEALALVERNLSNSSWAVPRQLKLTPPDDPKKVLSGTHSTKMGPIYDPVNDRMQGGIINTFSNLAFAETTFAIIQSKKIIGPVSKMNERSLKNRALVDKWIARNELFEHGVANPESRGSAVTLLKVKDPEITDPAIHADIIQKAKQILSYEGITHPDGNHEPGLDAARYINAFPGTPGDFRAWIGGIRSEDEIKAFLENLKYAYFKAKSVYLEEQLAKAGKKITDHNPSKETIPGNNPEKTYKVLISDLIDFKLDENGQLDYSELKQYIEGKEGRFHLGCATDHPNPEKGKIHFYYLPDLSREEAILKETEAGRYDALIATSTRIPAECKFPLGGVRIGVSTVNMGSASWGGGSGIGGVAPLMNIPGLNSYAIAHVAFKALLKIRSDLKYSEIRQQIVAGDVSTEKHLKDYSYTQIEGKRMAILGYGNVGREMAKLASTFKMNVIVYARPIHREWIESEGYEYAETILAAATHADVLSSHLGLGKLDDVTGKFSNAGIINSQILSAMNDSGVLIHYDQEELVEVDALEKALTSGKLSHVAIDADFFIESNKSLSSHLALYRKLLDQYADKLELLSYAALDTEHTSRLEGAKQAVDQVIDCIRTKTVINLVGDIPQGYVDGGSKFLLNMDKATPADFKRLSDDELKKIRKLTEGLYAFWSSVESMKDTTSRTSIIKKYAKQAILDSNNLAIQLKKFGLTGPFIQE